MNKNIDTAFAVIARIWMDDNFETNPDFIELYSKMSNGELDAIGERLSHLGGAFWEERDRRMKNKRKGV